MKQILKLVFLLVIGQTAFAQAPSNYTNINGRYRWIAGMFDSTFHIPKGSTPSLRTGGSTNSGGLFYNTSDSSVYTYTGTQWIKLRGSINPSDTTNKYVTQVYKKNASDSVFYVKGGNHLFAFIDSVGSPGGGGGGKVYYFNGGVSMGTFGGFAMYELGDTANTGAAANFTRSTTGNIANFITDPGKPGLLQIPAGVWSVDAWLSETGGGANHAEIWVEVEKWDGSTITTIATSPIEQITEGATPNLYSWSVSIPTTALTVTDRIIIQFYITNTNGKTVTLYTQNGYVGEVHTTFTTGIGAINGLTAPAQYLVTGTSGTDFNINSSTATHTFNLPTASATNRGALSTTDWSTFNNKIGGSLVSGYLTKATGTNTIDTSQIYQSSGLIGIGTTTPTLKLDVNGDVLINGLWAGRGSGNINTNAVLGRLAFNANTTGFQNVAVGNLTLYSNTTGSNNVAIGNSALSANTTANHNVAIGHNSMLNNTTGFQNVAVGIQSLNANTTGENNTAIGTGALGSITTGYYNAAIGLASGRYITSGANNTTSNESVYLGYDTRASANGNTNEIVIGGSAQGNGSNSVTLGNSSITKTILRSNVGIGTVTPDSALTVVNGAYFQRGVRMSGLPTGVGTKAVRINANGTLSVADTLANGISGTGTTNYIPKFTSSSAIGNSVLYESGGDVFVNTILSQGFANKFRIKQSTNGSQYGLGIESSTSTSELLYFSNTGSVAVIGQTYLGGGGSYQPIAFSTGGSERMRLDASGNLGIGTSSPGAKLEISTGGLSNGGLRLRQGSYNYWDITSAYATTNADLIFYMTGSEKMRLDASGNLGLGVTPSAWGSDSKGLQLTNYGSINGNSTTGILSLASNAYESSNNNWNRVNGTSAGLYQVSYTGQHTWYNTVAATAGSAISWTQAMTLDASGRLGIGATSMTYALQVNDVSGGNMFRFTSGSTILDYYVSAGNPSFGTASNNNLGFRTNDTERMRITSGGNVGIGTTSPASLLHIFSTSPTARLQGNTTTNLATISTLSFSNTNDITGGYQVASISAIRKDYDNGADLLFSTALAASTPTERMRITSGGELLINTTSDAGDYKLQVNGNVYATGGDIINNQNATTVFSLNNSTAGGSAFTEFRINASVGTGAFGKTSASTTAYKTIAASDLYIYNNTGAGNIAILNDKSGGSITMATNGNSTAQFTLTSSGNVETTGSIKTAAPSGGTAKPWKLGQAGVSVGGANTTAVAVEIDGTVYYLLTAYLPEPEPDPAALPSSGPSASYKPYNKPIPVKTTKDVEIENLRKEIEELKQLIKNK